MTDKADKVHPVVKWRMYDVTVGRWGTETITATSRGKALASAWRSDAFEGYTFAQFLKMARIRVRQSPPDPDGYDYVRRVYGVDPKIGERVRLRNEGSASGTEGTILYPGASTAHVRVILDGEKEPVIVHPDNVVMLTSRARSELGL